MTCEEMDTRLDDHVDGTLGAAEADEVAAHLAGCPACREDEAALREVLRLAAGVPREMAPPRDLWPGIAARLQTVRPAIPAWRLAVAAALLVAASSAVTWVLVAPDTPVADATPEPFAEPPTSAAVPVSHRADETTFVAAAEELQDALDQRWDDLAPETRAVVDRNLAAIDVALGEIRAALRQDPGNVELERRLGSVHRRKIEILQRVVRLSS